MQRRGTCTSVLKSGYFKSAKNLIIYNRKMFVCRRVAKQGIVVVLDRELLVWFTRNPE